MDKNLRGIISRFKLLDTASVSDALDSMNLEGALLGIKSQVSGAKCIGPAFTVSYADVKESKSFLNAANYIDDVPSGSVIVSSSMGREDCTIWGGILTRFASLKGISGTVIDGMARDVSTIKEMNYPLFCKGIYMRSGKNRVRLSATQEPIIVTGIKIEPGDIIFCDDNGCVAIPYAEANEIAVRAETVIQTESSITSAVYTGTPLYKARMLYRYDQPWLKR